MMIKKVLLVSRPRFWLYLLGPYILGIAASGLAQGTITTTLLYGFFYFLLPANIFIYVANDYFDREIDFVNPKKHQREKYMLKHDAKMYLLLIALCLFLSLPLLLVNMATSIALMLFLFFGLFYSSPPLRFKTKPILDSVSNFFYILPGIVSYALITATFPPLHILIAASLWAIAMHLFSAIVDISADMKAGIKTTATILGYRNSLVLTSLLWLFSIVFVLSHSPFLSIGFIYPLIPLILLWKMHTIQRVYWYFPWINAVVGFSIFFLLVFHE